MLADLYAMIKERSIARLNQIYKEQFGMVACLILLMCCLPGK
jgi:hypothetical protein